MINGAPRYLAGGGIHHMCLEIWTIGMSKHHQFDSHWSTPPNTHLNNQLAYWNSIVLGSFHCIAFGTQSVFTKSIALMANRDAAWIPTV